MDNFIKKSSSRTEELKELAEFDLNAIELEDKKGNQRIVDSKSTLIEHTKSKKYNLELTVWFRTICHIVGSASYDFGIESAIIKIKFITRIDQRTSEIYTKIDDFVEKNNERNSAVTGDFATNRLGLSINKGNKSSEKSKIKIVWPSVNENELIVNFSVRNVSDNILLEKYGSAIVGTLDLNNSNDSKILSVLTSTEIAIAHINGKEVKPNLSQLILRLNLNRQERIKERIKEIKKELIGELQNVELQYIGK